MAENVNVEGRYGGCEGSASMYVILVSSDGHEFIIKREHLHHSATLRAMVTEQDQLVDDNEPNKIFFRDVPSHLIQKLCQFLIFKSTYIPDKDAPKFSIPPEMALELFAVAHFLDC